jgi:transposase
LANQPPCLACARQDHLIALTSRKTGAALRLLYAGNGRRQGERRKAEPDWTHVHHELRRPGVTLMLLWEEYRQREPDG